MSEDDLPELDATARKLLSAGGGTIDLQPGAQERVAARLAASMAALGPVDDGAGGHTSTTASTTSGAAASALPRVPLWLVGAAFVAGGAVGFVVHGSVGTRDAAPSPSIIATARTIEAAPSRVPETTSGAALPTELPSTVAISPSSLPNAAESPSASKFTRAGDLSEERKILDDARAAFGGGDPEAAISKMRAHERRFPRGALSEEREALWVQALAQAGKSDEARARAEKFEQNYPESMLLPSVKAAARAGGKVTP